MLLIPSHGPDVAVMRCAHDTMNITHKAFSDRFCSQKQPSQEEENTVDYDVKDKTYHGGHMGCGVAFEVVTFLDELFL